MKNYYTKALLLIAGYCFLSSAGTIEAKPSYREYWSLHQKLFTQHEDKAYYQTLNENFKKSNANREDYLNRFPEYTEARGSNRTKIKKKLTEDGEV